MDVNLVPFANDSDLSQVNAPCNGLFTSGPGDLDKKLVVGFVGQNLFFGGVNLSGTTGDFAYGVGLKQ